MLFNLRLLVWFGLFGVNYVGCFVCVGLILQLLGLIVGGYDCACVARDRFGIFGLVACWLVDDDCCLTLNCFC